MKNSLNKHDHLDESADKLRPQEIQNRQPSGVSDSEHIASKIKQKHHAEQLLHHSEATEQAQKTINDHKNHLNTLKTSTINQQTSPANSTISKPHNINPTIDTYSSAQAGKKVNIQKVISDIEAMKIFFAVV